MRQSKVQRGNTLQPFRRCIFKYEKNIAQTNKKLNDRIETIFIITPPEISHISSTIVRDIIKNGGDVSKFVPKQINL